MSERWGRIASWTTGMAGRGAIVFVLLIVVTGATPATASAMMAILFAIGLVIAAAGAIFARLFPNAVRKHEEEQQKRTFVGDGDY